MTRLYCWEMVQKKEVFIHEYMHCFFFLIKKEMLILFILIKCKLLLPLFSCSHTPSLAPWVCELVVLTKGVS